MSTKKLTYAGWHERLFAYLLDGMVLLIPTAMLVSMLGGKNLETPSGPLLLAIFILNVVYRVGFTASSWQATPGKRILGIYIIRVDGKTLTPRDALERHLAYIMPLLPAYTSILSESTALIITLWLSMFWFIPILTTPERTGLHDKICGTRVVKGIANAA